MSKLEPPGCNPAKRDAKHSQKKKLNAQFNKIYTWFPFISSKNNVDTTTKNSEALKNNG